MYILMPRKILEKITKQKQRQTQKTVVNVHIGDKVAKRKKAPRRRQPARNREPVIDRLVPSVVYMAGQPAPQPDQTHNIRSILEEQRLENAKERLALRNEELANLRSIYYSRNLPPATFEEQPVPPISTSSQMEEQNAPPSAMLTSFELVEPRTPENIPIRESLAQTVIPKSNVKTPVKIRSIKLLRTIPESEWTAEEVKAVALNEKRKAKAKEARESHKFVKRVGEGEGVIGIGAISSPEPLPMAGGRRVEVASIFQSKNVRK